MHPLSRCILRCADEADRREKAKIKRIKEKQANCKHTHKSRPRHIGQGWMSQYCLNCGKYFGYTDRG